MNDRISIADQAAQAISYMHNLSPPMIHRDIKPMNILVSWLGHYSHEYHAYLSYAVVGRERYPSCLSHRYGFGQAKN